jgi:hypothetical protein
MDYKDIWEELKTRINLNINEEISRNDLLKFMNGLEMYLDEAPSENVEDMDQES